MIITISLSSGFITRQQSGFGTVIVDPQERGRIAVLTDGPYSPTKHSVTDFFVEDKYRKQGVGAGLIKEVIRRYRADIGAQTSSVESTRLFYAMGFRPYVKPTASLSETVSMFKKDESLNMRYKSATTYEPE